MLQARPGIHRYGAKLNFGIIFSGISAHAIREIRPYRYDHMITSITVRFYVPHIVFFFDDLYVFEPLYKTYDLVDVVYKRAHYPDSYGVMDLLQSRPFIFGKPFPSALFPHTFLGFYSGGQMFVYALSPCIFDRFI